MQTMILVAVALAVIVLIGLVWGIVRTARASSLSRRLMEVPPVTGRVVESRIVKSNFYVTSGGTDHGPVTPVGARHFTKRVETIEYPGPDGHVLRGEPVLSEGSLPDRTGQDVRVHVAPDRPTDFLAPVGERMSMGSVYLRTWGVVLFCVVLVGLFACVFGLLFGFDTPQPRRP